MSNVIGIQRLRQAIDNQSAAGEACFSLPMGEARALCDEVEDELARLSWAAGVPAPVDADGEVVPLTTEVVYDGDGIELAVSTLEFKRDGYNKGWTLFCALDTNSTAQPYGSQELHLNRPDSWERLEKDIRNAENGGACGYYGIGTEPCNEGCPGYKDLETPCEAIAMKDVLCRAKALAERDAKGASDEAR